MKVILIVVLLSGKYYTQEHEGQVTTYDSLDACFEAGNEVIRGNQGMSFVCLMRPEEVADEPSIND